MTSVSLFGGTGFIGSHYKSLSQNEVQLVDRQSPDPVHREILYLIGTTDNYNIFEEPKLGDPVSVSALPSRKLIEMGWRPRFELRDSIKSHWDAFIKN